MFQNLEVENYKLFKNFKCENFQLINTFTGDNNTGKSTLLEALRLLISYSSPTTHLSLVMSRLFKISEPRDYTLLFSDAKEKMSIKSKYDSKNILVSYKISKDILKNNEINGLVFSSEFENKPLIENCKVLTTFHKDKESESKIEYDEEDKLNQQDIRFRYIPFQVDLPTIEEFTALNRLGQRDKLIAFLNEIFNENIKDIFSSKNLIEVTSRNHSSSLPLEFLGYGIGKVLELFTAFSLSYEVILIDEIEKGLHYSKMQKIFQKLFTMAIEKKTQVFITTHSEDVLQAIENVLRTDENIAKNFQHYSLIKNKDSQIESINCGAEEFIGSRKTSLDIRD